MTQNTVNRPVPYEILCVAFELDYTKHDHYCHPRCIGQHHIGRCEVTLFMIICMVSFLVILLDIIYTVI
jgi:hypothetical protein